MRKHKGYILSLTMMVLFLGFFSSGGVPAAKPIFSIYPTAPGSAPVSASPHKPVTGLYRFEMSGPDRVLSGEALVPDGMADFFKPDGGTVSRW